MNTLGERIKYAREKLLKISQNELAKLVGFSQASLAWIESGKTRNPRNIDRIAKALDVSKEWLLIGGALPAPKTFTPDDVDELRKRLDIQQEEIKDLKAELRFLKTAFSLLEENIKNNNPPQK